ncbi:MAG: molybdopterin-dependent oxidoreductase, partial [Microthrixaceae bacterium]|nr:molybdopterin-dependent oxidoreductase [Microthrixaceae bacterium]
TVILLGPDPKETLGALYIRLKHAVVEDGATLIEVTPRRTGLSRYAAASLTYRAGEAAAVVAALLDGSAGAPEAGAEVGGVDGADIAAAASLLASANGPVTVVLGRASIAESAATIVDAATLLSERLDGVRFLAALRRANVHGALDLGMSPGLLPGRVTREAGAAWFGQAWPTVPTADGLDAAGILQAAADGKIDTLVLLGADPLSDFVDRDLAERALTGARSVIAVDQFLTDSSQRANVVLAASAFAEDAGTTTNLEGRVTLLAQKVTAHATTRPDWTIAVDLADRLGADLGFEDVEAIWAEIEELSVAHSGVTLDALRASLTEGVVVPLPAPEPAPVSDESSETGDTQISAAAEEMSPDQETADAPEPEVDETSGPDLIEAPEPLVFTAASRTEVPAVDAYALRLVATRTMYDHGTLTQHSPASAGSAPAATLHLNPADFDKAGVSAEGRIKVTNGQRSIVVPAIADATIAKGTAVMSVGTAEVSVTQLIEVGAPVTDVRLEAAR